MTTRKFIGRKEELTEIGKALAGQGFRRILVYGMRRVGKSVFIKEAFKSFTGKAILFQCIEGPGEINSKALVSILKELFPAEYIPDSLSLQSAIEWIFAKAKTENIALAIDEIPI